MEPIDQLQYDGRWHSFVFVLALFFWGGGGSGVDIFFSDKLPNPTVIIYNSW